MYSMNYLGKVFANFREFYNEINAATLTGAIDVVVVEQPDGSFTCSPFHVRFGKLGVLRSRLKVVDLELNGEPLSIHMKLGESGEAFFVEEIPEDEVEASAHLATSPIPDNGFLYPTQQPATLPRRNSADYPLDKYQNQVSDFSHRRYTDGQGTQKSDFSAQKREYQIMNDNKMFGFNQDLVSQEQEPMFAMDDLDDPPPEFTCKVEQITTTTITTGAAKMFRAEEVNDKDSHAKEVVRKISINNDFRPISMAKDDPTLPPTNEGKQCTEEAAIQNQPEEIPKSQPNGNNKKKKKTKKSGSKKKNAQRKSSSSSNGYSSQSETIATESVETEKTNERLSAEQIDTEDISPSPAYSMTKMIPDVHFYSDTDVLNESTGRDGTPVQSDSELEMARGSGTGGIGGADGGPPSQSWRWGELPSPPPNAALDTITQQEQLNLQDKGQMEHPVSPGATGTSSSMLSGMFSFMKPSRGNPQAAEAEGMYLAELATGAVDPEVAALYFPPSQGNASAPSVTESLTVDINAAVATEEDYESGNGPSLPQSPSSVEGPMCKGIDSDEDDIKIFCKGYVGLSLCGPSCLQQSPAALAEAFEQEAVRFEALCDDPSLVQNPRLVVRLGDQYMPWLAAAPMLISLIVFHRPLPKSVVQNLPGAVDGVREKVGAQGAEGGAGKAQQRQGYSWWYWRRSTDKQSTSDPPKPSVDSVDGNRTNLEQESSTTNTQEKTSVADLSQDTEKIEDQKSEERESPQEVSTQTSFPLLGGSGIAGGGGYSGSQSSEESDEGGATVTTTSQTHSKNSDKFRKTLRLSSDQIASLNLREGMNEMLFSVTTAYQGTSRCKCHVFRWRHDDKIVISDIDGTITKSDVLGHIFPLVGKDWAQSGVAQLFTKIKNNGYKILYLSARAIGQAKVTREYLRSIKQGDLSLPDGPLLLNPTSLLRAFHREVIEKKPEEFKIQCLSDIMALFPEGSKPFYAGYGNRINDVCAYETVGIPIVRIFTINSKGELKHELTQTFQSSYSNMSYIVDHLFPPVRGELCEDFSQFVYWREPVAALPSPPAPPQHSTLPSIPEGPSD